MTTTTNVEQVKLNILTTAQYNALQEKNPTELYFITDAKISYNDLADLPTIPVVDQSYSASSTNAQSGVAVASAISNSGFLQNTATSENALTLLGVPTTGSNYFRSINIGYNSSVVNWDAIAIGTAAQAKSQCAVAIGCSSSAQGSYTALALGAYAVSSANFAIQLGGSPAGTSFSTNSEANSLKVCLGPNTQNYKLLGSDGKIPSGRLPIATSVSSSSTNDETVGAKLFYDTVGDIETALHTINSGS